jgi:tetratricopeptide (TPR) repeat protein
MKNIPKFTFFLIFLSLLIINYKESPAQKQGQARIDSLLKELPKAKEDTNKVNILKDLCYCYSTINPNEGIEYGELGVQLAEKLNWKKGIAGSLNNVGTCYYTKSNYNKALDYYFKSLKLHEEIGDNKQIAANLGNIGNIYKRQYDLPKTMEYYSKTLKIYEKLGNKSGIGWALGSIANVYNLQSNNPKALEYYFKALKIYEELGDKSKIAVNLGNIGNVYNEQSNYFMALDNFFKALKINEELGVKSGIALNLGNIGLLYMEQSDYSKALDYYFKALKIYEELGDKSGIARNLVNIGGAFGNKNDLSKALEYEFKALKITEEIGDKRNQFTIFNTIGNIYEIKSDYTKAIEYYKKALNVSSELGDRHISSDILGSIGCLYYIIATNKSQSNKQNILNKKNYLLMAVENLEECIRIHHEIGRKHSEMLFLENLFKSYKELGNYKKAFENYQRYSTLKDSTFSFEKSKEIANLQANYKVEKKEKENKILKLEVEKQTGFRNFLIVISILILLLAVVAYNRYLHKKKTGKILEEKNQKLNEANEVIEMTYKEKIQLQQETHNKETQINSLKTELLEKELEQKQKELTVLALNLVDKNEYMMKLKEQAEELGKAKPELIMELTKNIARSIYVKLRSEDAWEAFEMHFKSIHRGFMEYMANLNLDLSVTELKVCALLKINLSSKEIASLLSLSLRTVEDHRLNIRRKLSLDTDVNLNQYIAGLKFK